MAKQPQETHRLLGYCRVSTSEQLASIEAQKETISKYCNGLELGVPEFIIDEAVSGSVAMADRPGGRTLIQVKNATIVTTKVDRLFRSFIDSANTFEHWDKQKVTLHIIDFCNGALDTGNPMIIASIRVMSVFADFERKMVAQRTKTILQSMKGLGKRISRRPNYGYKFVGDDMVPDEYQQKVLNDIRIMNDAGYTLTMITNELIARGVPTSCGGKWRRNTIGSILGKVRE